VLQVATDVAASGIRGVFVGFPISHLSLFGSYPLDLSGLGDLTGSNATASLALRVTVTHKPLYDGKVEIPTKGKIGILCK
jgi:hypothetical protein